MSVDMRSAIYMGQRQIKVKNTPIPHVSEHDVLIQNIEFSHLGTTFTFKYQEKEYQTSYCHW